MPIGDDLNPYDEILTRLSRPQEPTELPGLLQCPAGHQVTRFICEMERAIEGALLVSRIPYWACPECLVVYRYQECRLLPGDEGHP